MLDQISFIGEDLQNRVSNQFELLSTASCINVSPTFEAKNRQRGAKLTDSGQT